MPRRRSPGGRRRGSRSPARGSPAGGRNEKPSSSRSDGQRQTPLAARGREHAAGDIRAKTGSTAAASSTGSPSPPPVGLQTSHAEALFELMVAKAAAVQRGESIEVPGEGEGLKDGQIFSAMTLGEEVAKTRSGRPAPSGASCGGQVCNDAEILVVDAAMGNSACPWQVVGGGREGAGGGDGGGQEESKGGGRGGRGRGGGVRGRGRGARGAPKETPSAAVSLPRDSSNAKKRTKVASFAVSTAPQRASPRCF